MPIFVVQLGMMFRDIRVLRDYEGAQFEDVGSCLELIWDMWGSYYLISCLVVSKSFIMII